MASSNTALYPAVITGDIDRVRSLLGHSSTDVNVRGRANQVPLHRAAKLNRVEITECLLAHSQIDVNAQDNYLRTALHMACKRGHTQIVEMLLRCNDPEKVIDVNANAKGGITPLHVAAYCGSNETVELLLGHPSIDLNCCTAEEFTPLHMCACSGYDIIVRQILEAHRKAGKSDNELREIINAPDKIGRTPLHYAVCEGNKDSPVPVLRRIEVIKELFKTELVSVNAQDRDGHTALHLAARDGNPQVVCLLMDRADINPNICTKSESLLGSATPDGKRDTNIKKTTKTLVDEIQLNAPFEQLPRPKMADYIFQRRGKMTALHYAVEENQEESHDEVISAILQHEDINVQILNSANKSPMDIALSMKDMSTLVKLIHACGSAKFSQYEKLLRQVVGAKKKGYEAVLSELMRHITNDVSEEVVRQGLTTWREVKYDVILFHQMALLGHEKLLDTILENFPLMVPKINAADSDQQTPLHYAAITGMTSVVKVLISKEYLRANEEDRYGRTALQIAIENEHKEIEKLLLERSDVKNYVDRLYRDRQVYVDAANAILVGAALIASVTFAGWLQPPLGYTPYYEFAVSNPAAPPGTFESYASVQQHVSTRVFWVCNSLSFFSAIATVIAGAGAVLPMLDVFIGEEVRVVRRSLVLTSVLLVFAVVFVLGAFAAAGFASLPPIVYLQVNMIVTCIIGIGLCVAILAWFLRRLYRIRPSWWRTLEKNWFPRRGVNQRLLSDRYFYMYTWCPLFSLGCDVVEFAVHSACSCCFRPCFAYESYDFDFFRSSALAMLARSSSRPPKNCRNALGWPRMEGRGKTQPHSPSSAYLSHQRLPSDH